MKIKEFKKLLKTDSPKHIIFLHTISKIYLTDKQLQLVIDMKNEGGAK